MGLLLQRDANQLGEITVWQGRELNHGPLLPRRVLAAHRSISRETTANDFAHLSFFLPLRSSPSSGRGERGCAIAVTNPFCITVILVIMSSLHFLYRLKE